MRSCNVPGQASAPVGPWAWTQARNTSSFNECADGGGFGVQFQSIRSMRQYERAQLDLSRPATGPKQNIDIKRLRLWMVARLSGSGAPAFTPLQAFAADGSMQQTETWGPPGGNSLSSPVVTPVYPDGTNSFSAILLCSSGAPGDCSLDSSKAMEIRGAEITLSESVLPSIELGGGTLSSAGPQSGTRSVGYTAVDRESGVAKVEVLLDDRVVAVRDFSADRKTCPHVSWNACEEQIIEEVTVNTGTVADGDYVLGLRATDAAGNGRVTRHGPIVIRNQAPAASPPVGTAPAAQNSGMRVTHVNSTRTLVTKRLIRYGSRATLRGVLRDPAGRPMPNTQLDVVMRTDRKNSWLRKVATRTTDADGRFEYKTPPGPSRLVRFGYGATSAGSSYTFTHDVKVNVRSGVRMSRSRKSLRNGQRLRLYGTIQGIKQRKVVEIQVRKAEGWDTIASVRSNSKGGWSWRYRFERTYEPTRYTFRARVRTDEGFPYATGYSPKRTVRVR
jgi:hypothetical protein